MAYSNAEPPKNIFHDHHKVEHIYNVLNVTAYDRSLEDIKFIEGVMREGQFFKKFDTTNAEFFSELCQRLKVESHHRSGKKLYTEGDIGDKFYIILKGSVQRIKHQIKEAPITNPTRSFQKISNKADERLIMQEAECFGELALLGPQRCGYSVIIDQPCELIVLTKESLQEIFGHHDYNYINHKSYLDIRKDEAALLPFAQSKFLRDLPNQILEKICSRTFLQEFPANTLIHKQGEVATNLAFVKKGQLLLKRKVHKSQLEDAEFLRMKYGQDFDNCPELIRSDVRKVNPGKFICDYEILQQIPLLNTVTTTIKSELICISVYDLVSILQAEDVRGLKGVCAKELTDLDVFLSYTKNNDWAKFKNHLVDTIMYEKANRKGALTGRKVQGEKFQKKPIAVLDFMDKRFLGPKSMAPSYKKWPNCNEGDRSRVVKDVGDMQIAQMKHLHNDATRRIIIGQKSPAMATCYVPYEKEFRDFKKKSGNLSRLNTILEGNATTRRH
jgi:CRP-like cAMP-binding protein